MDIKDEKQEIDMVEEQEQGNVGGVYSSKEENIGLPLPEIDRVAEKKLIRKLDIHLVPIVMLLYLLSYLDRVNIGNARYAKSVRIYCNMSFSLQLCLLH